ncbi:MAG TPA: bifunctional acetate--CoA ligase family protein/GNAT family N-acetyltransferase [Gammaproteobacteria bacterium]|nr:bifunctional acetate--CoA ligase family protein/GNAT family N-acetyltransferase [Gammaproteobacteria bacterium]
MTTCNLGQLLHPGSVALIGASADPAKVGHALARNLTGQFHGPVYFVNPKYQAIDGQPCWSDVASLPAVPDLAVICTPAKTVPGLVRELGARGVRAVIVVSAGFGESGAGGQALQQALLEAAKPTNLRIVGPNCIGVLNPSLGLNASFSHAPALPGHTAFVTQSGALLAAVLDWARPRGIGFSHMISLGDMADVDFADLMDYLAGDGNTRAILLYIEGIRQARRFMSAARAAARIKPVIVVKSGRHAEAARAAATHTGALAGADAVYDAAFRRAGMLRVPDLAALFDAVDVLTLNTPPVGDRLAILTNGGGMGVLATDALMEGGGELAKLSDATFKALDQVLPPTWSHGNPVDVIGDADGARYRAALQPLLADPGVDAVLALYCPTGVSDPGEIAASVAEMAGRRGRVPILANWVGGEAVAAARHTLSGNHVPSFDTPEEAVRAFMYLADYRRNQDLLMQTPPSLPQEFTPDTTAARALVGQALAEGREWLTEIESKALLEAYTIPTVPTRFAADADAAAAVARGFAGPYALKIVSPQITHKSDVGGVALGLPDADAVRAAAHAMTERVHRRRPDAVLSGFSVQAMVERREAQELIAGIVTDLQFGPVILFGQGGTAVELIADKALGLPPLNMRLARSLMRETRIHRLLQGYRDRKPADLDAVALTLVKLAQLAAELPEVIELDINPLLADADGVLALDARVKVGASAGAADSRLAIKPYPKELEQVITAKGGDVLWLRPIVPEDEPALSRTFDLLTPEEIRQRFHVPMKAFPHTLAARLTQIDYDREMALVLTEHQPPGKADINGVVRLSADPDNEKAEFALLVRQAYARHGLGLQMLQRLTAYARGRGIGELYGLVLADNHAMRGLCRKAGFKEEGVLQEASVVRVSLKLD